MINSVPRSIDLDDVETIRDASARIGVPEKTIRQWLRRHPDELAPVVPGVVPLFVFCADVDRCANRRRSARRAAQRRAKDRFFALGQDEL